MRETKFRFKHFDCEHGRSSMKIGVDAVLLGAWADMTGKSILDVGTGCGVIALMCAQRNSDARIKAIDIDPESIKEAERNFQRSPWSSRLCSYQLSYESVVNESFDLIISNPPYFNSGIEHPDSSRLIARHQSVLNPAFLLIHGSDLLNERGRISLIVPYGQKEELLKTAQLAGLTLRRACKVKGHFNAPFKRIMMEFYKGEIQHNFDLQIEELYLEDPIGTPSYQYRALCKDFYLKF